MTTLFLTGDEFALALEVLKAQNISGNEFCRRCNTVPSSQSYWKKHGISGAAAKILFDLLGSPVWDEIKAKGDGHGATA